MNKWYQIKKECSVKLIKLIMGFCDKIISETKARTKEIEQNIKEILNEESFIQLRTTIEREEELTCSRLKRRKTKTSYVIV